MSVLDRNELNYRPLTEGSEMSTLEERNKAAQEAAAGPVALSIDSLPEGPVKTGQTFWLPILTGKSLWSA
jgi:hypothetical protein